MLGAASQSHQVGFKVLLGRPESVQHGLRVAGIAAVGLYFMDQRFLDRNDVSAAFDMLPRLCKFRFCWV